MMRCEKCGGGIDPRLKGNVIDVEVDGLRVYVQGIPKCEACGCARLTEKGLSRLRVEVAVAILRKECSISWPEADFVKHIAQRLQLSMWDFDNPPPMSFIVDPVAVENTDSWEWRLLK